MLMITPTTTPPPVGTVGVGELLADAQSKTLWLGVAATVDPAQAVLIADMLATEAYTDDALDAAKAYTDSRVATRAPTVHTHAIADVTGLQAALDHGANSIPIGCILLWSGTIITIPAGFVLCDGANGTPDLKDKFVMGGGGSRTVGSSGGASTLTGRTSVDGAHAHTGNTLGHALTIAELAAHNHGYTDPGHVHGYSDPGHVHSVPQGGGSGPAAIGSGAGTFASTAAQSTQGAGIGISIAAAASGITIANAGSGVAHTHPINSDGGHDHGLSGMSILPPFYVLAFIQRIA